MKDTDESLIPLLNTSEPVVILMPEKSAIREPHKIMNVYVDPLFEKEVFPLADYEQETEYKFNSQFSQEYTTINAAINRIASELLYHWKTVPIIFPESISKDIKKNAEEFINCNDLFILPTVNELEELSRDGQGNIKKLNNEQLKSIKRNGTFEVPSAHFPDKVHRWTLANWLQRGYENSNKQFFRDLSRALYLLIITAKNRFTHKKFSVYGGLRTWRDRAFDLLDAFIGMPQKYVDYENVAVELSERLETFLISGLKVNDSDKEAFSAEGNGMLFFVVLYLFFGSNFFFSSHLF